MHIDWCIQRPVYPTTGVFNDRCIQLAYPTAAISNDWRTKRLTNKTTGANKTPGKSNAISTSWWIEHRIKSDALKIIRKLPKPPNHLVFIDNQKFKIWILKSEKNSRQQKNPSEHFSNNRTTIFSPAPPFGSPLTVSDTFPFASLNFYILV